MLVEGVLPLELRWLFPPLLLLVSIVSPEPVIFPPRFPPAGEVPPREDERDSPEGEFGVAGLRPPARGLGVLLFEPKRSCRVAREYKIRGGEGLLVQSLSSYQQSGGRITREGIPVSWSHWSPQELVAVDAVDYVGTAPVCS